MTHSENNNTCIHLFLKDILDFSNYLYNLFWKGFNNYFGKNQDWVCKKNIFDNFCCYDSIKLFYFHVVLLNLSNVTNT